MPENPSIYLRSVAYTLGEARRVEDLPLEPALRESLLEQDAGLEFYRHSPEHCVDLLRRSARETVAQYPNPSELDTLLIASNSLHPAKDWVRIGQLQQELGLEQARAVMLSVGDCSNFHSALSTASALIAQNEAENLLLLLVDRVDDAASGDRLAMRGAGINSDAAASCVISARPSAGYRLLGRGARVLVPPRKPDMQEQIQLDFVQIMQLVRKLTDRLYGDSGLEPRDFTQILTNTYKRSVVETLAMAARLPPQKAFMGNVARTGHCFAADNLINLHDAAAAGSVKTGDKVMLLGAGVSNWSACAAQAVY